MIQKDYLYLGAILSDKEKSNDSSLKFPWVKIIF
jgi:hypothetical protein